MTQWHMFGYCWFTSISRQLELLCWIIEDPILNRLDIRDYLMFIHCILLIWAYSPNMLLIRESFVTLYCFRLSMLCDIYPLTNSFWLASYGTRIKKLITVLLTNTLLDITVLERRLWNAEFSHKMRLSTTVLCLVG